MLSLSVHFSQSAPAMGRRARVPTQKVFLNQAMKLQAKSKHGTQSNYSRLVEPSGRSPMVTNSKLKEKEVNEIVKFPEENSGSATDQAGSSSRKLS